MALLVLIFSEGFGRFEKVLFIVLLISTFLALHCMLVFTMGPHLSLRRIIAIYFYRKNQNICDKNNWIAYLDKIREITWSADHMTEREIKVEKIWEDSLDLIPSPISENSNILTGKFTCGNKAKHCCQQTPSNVLPLHLKQNFLPIIWIFTEGEGVGMESMIPYKIFFTLIFWISTS